MLCWPPRAQPGDQAPAGGARPQGGGGAAGPLPQGAAHRARRAGGGALGAARPAARRRRRPGAELRLRRGPQRPGLPGRRPRRRGRRRPLPAHLRLHPAAGHAGHRPGRVAEAGLHLPPPPGGRPAQRPPLRRGRAAPAGRHAGAIHRAPADRRAAGGGAPAARRGGRGARRAARRPGPAAHGRRRRSTPCSGAASGAGRPTTSPSSRRPWPRWPTGRCSGARRCW